MKQEEIDGIVAWNDAAKQAMINLLQAHEALDREKLQRVLNGIRILVDDPANETS